ncbi:MAG: lipid export ATP-binding/permease protein MsbA, partial [Ilumatobacteraceae bacterium]|nr:lipid export ATP-binding/permease protein MsbA [Ilumatobacteraceae bacterium]
MTEEDDKPPRPPDSELRGPAGGRMGLRLGMPAEKPMAFGPSLRRVLRRLRPERVGVITVLCLAVVSVSLAVLGPKVLGHATDIIVKGVIGSDLDFSALYRVLAVVVGLYVSSALFQWLQAHLLAGIVQRTMFGLRSDVEDKLNAVPLSYVDGQQRGDLLSRVTNDIDNLAQSLQQTMSQLLTSALTLVGVMAMMFWISPLLALVALITIPLSTVLVRIVMAKSQPRFVAQWRHTGVLNAHVEESITGHAIVRAFGRQQESHERFTASNEELYQASFSAQFASGIIQPAMMCLGNLNFVAIAVVGGLRVSSGSITIGDIQAFIQYSRQFTQPITQVATMLNVLQSGIASAERVFELLDAPEQRPDSSERVRSETPSGHVSFDDVSFSYDPARPLIHDLSLTAEAGKTIAIVGPTGAGKTTLVNLIMRFYEIDGGAIRLDGVDISSMPRDELRSQIGMVLQDTWLFDGSIRDNIGYGKVGATDDEIMAAAKATYVDRFVHSLPEGYDTVVGDDGDMLSVGEKQLITIARAFLADPSILILDEATSSVDTRTEVLVQQAMASLRSRRTSF